MAPHKSLTSHVKGIKENVSKMSSLSFRRMSSGRSLRHSNGEDSCAEPSEGACRGVCIVGNGRSVLSMCAGPLVDQFETVLRFNDFQICGFEKHVCHHAALPHLTPLSLERRLVFRWDRKRPCGC